MQLARMTFGLGLIGLVCFGGCRSTSTDRMRVLEAEKAETDRINKEQRDELAALRAKEMQTQAELDRERARAKAADDRSTISKKVVGVNPDRFKQPGVEVTTNEDGGATIVMASDVTFTPGRADLNSGALTILKRVASELKSTDGVGSVRIEGHTDSDPIRRSGWKSNEALSLARARMVREYLVTQGIQQDIRGVHGFGAQKPVASNKTAGGKARNRRVAIILLPQ